MSTLDDLRHALGSLLRVPAFTLAAAVSLSLGIAASATVFSLLDAAVFRPPPFAEAGRLMLLHITQRTPALGERRHRWSWPRFQLLERSVQSFEGVASSSNAVVTLSGIEDPQPVHAEIVSPRYLALLRAPIALGTGFRHRADGSDEPPAIVLGHDLWRHRFASAGDILGRAVEINGVPLTVIGVAARGFAGVSGLAEVWIPTPAAPRITYPDYLTTNQNFITVIGRLSAGVTPDEADAELRVLGQRIHASQPSEADSPEDRFSASLMTLNEARVDVDTRRALIVLMGAAGLLMLLACANVTNLVLGRAAERRREIAIRLAVGASRWRLVRQLLTESSVLAAGSGGAALLVAIWSMGAAQLPPTLARGRNFYGAVGEFAMPTLDLRVFAFTVALSLGTVVAVGLMPALQSTRADLTSDLKTGGRGRRSGSGRLSVRDAAVALQIAIAVVLTVGSGLLLASYQRIRVTPLGFEPDRLLTFMIRPSEVKYPAAAAPALLNRVLDEIERVPGVSSATVDGCAPLTVCARGTLHIVGRPWTRSTDAPTVRRHYVAPAHFATLGVPVVRGRGLSRDDRAGRAPVAVINEAAAARFWPDTDPIGQRIWFEGAPATGSADASAEIVGVVADVAYEPLDETPIQADVFTPYAQFTYATRMVLVRTHGAPLAVVPDVARAVRRADPALALFDVQSMEQRARQSWSKQSSETAFFTVIGGVALCLAIAGVYGVTAFLVASRRRELGIRIALGAPASRIISTSVGRTVQLGLAGATTGIVAAIALGRVLHTSLYETSPLDPAVYVGAAVVLIASALAASVVPVRRALSIDPIEVLRSE